MTGFARRRATALVAASLTGMLVAGALTACGGSRDRARDDLVDQLIEGGLSDELADCVVEAFFEARDDDELREFFARDELTVAERDEFARLGEACTAGT